MSLPTAYKTHLSFDGRILYRIAGAPGRLFVQHTYGDVEACVQTLTCWRRTRFARCFEAETEIEWLGWTTTEKATAESTSR